MNNEKALDILKRLRIALINDRVDGDRVFEPLGIGVKALEKQTAKKPTCDSMSSPGICPKCFKNDINILTMNGLEIWDRVNFCPNCGQKIDWN